jgi:hypothetical protein
MAARRPARPVHHASAAHGRPPCYLACHSRASSRIDPLRYGQSVAGRRPWSEGVRSRPIVSDPPRLRGVQAPLGHLGVQVPGDTSPRIRRAHAGKGTIPRASGPRYPHRATPSQRAGRDSNGTITWAQAQGVTQRGGSSDPAPRRPRHLSRTPQRASSRRHGRGGAEAARDGSGPEVVILRVQP